MVIVVLFAIFHLAVPSTEFDVVTGNKTEISRTAEIGVVTGVEFAKNKTTIEYTHGTWGLGWDRYDKIDVNYNGTLLPKDLIKVHQILMQGSDCQYFTNGVQRDPSMFDIKMKTSGDICGLYSVYEVEKVE